MQSKFTHKKDVLTFYQKDIQIIRTYHLVHKTNTTLYRITKYLVSLLNPLTRNDYNVKDSVEASNTAKNIVISPDFLCGNFAERHSFSIVSSESPETMRKLPSREISTLGSHVKLQYFFQCKRIQVISNELLSQSYEFVSFNDASLFTNVPLNVTVKIILKQTYDDKAFPNTLQKRAIKKLILVACTKTAFSFHNKF